MHYRFTVALAALIVSVPMMTLAAPIDSACVKSGRAQAGARICGCIQQVADQTLSRSEQRRAARFFADPHRAQEVRTSKRDSDSAFWRRYRNFATQAEALCR